MPALNTLLAVDAGLRVGLALYGGDGRLRWYRSHHYGTRAHLKKAVYSLMGSLDGLSCIALEGGGDVAEPWRKEARRREVTLLQVDAREWRKELLLARDRRSGVDAKDTADRLARRVIEWSGADRPTSLRHDAAEAILVGLWAVTRLGWVAEGPL